MLYKPVPEVLRENGKNNEAQHRGGWIDVADLLSYTWNTNLVDLERRRVDESDESIFEVSRVQSVVNIIVLCLFTNFITYSKGSGVFRLSSYSKQLSAAAREMLVLEKTCPQ